MGEIEGVRRDGDSAQGKPVLTAGMDGSGNVQTIITDTDGHPQVDVLSTVLPTGAATAAKQDEQTALLTTIDVDTSALAGCVVGTEVQADIVAALPAGAAIIGQVGIDQTTPGTTDRTTSNVDKLGGQAIDLGAGAVDVGTQRTTLASDDPAVALLGTIDADTSALAGCVGGTEVQVDVVSSALPSGAATEATLGTIDADTSLLAACVGGTEIQVDIVSSALPTGAATEATLATIDADTSALAGCVGGAELQVDVVSSALPTGAATEATLATIDTDTGNIADVAGTTTGAAQTTDGNATIQQYLRGLVKVHAAAVTPVEAEDIAADVDADSGGIPSAAGRRFVGFSYHATDATVLDIVLGDDADSGETGLFRIQTTGAGSGGDMWGLPGISLDSVGISIDHVSGTNPDVTLFYVDL